MGIAIVGGAFALVVAHMPGAMTKCVESLQGECPGRILFVHMPLTCESRGYFRDAPLPDLLRWTGDDSAGRQPVSRRHTSGRGLFFSDLERDHNFGLGQ